MGALIHNKQKEVQKLIEANINVLLEGEAGSGKTTILKNIAKDLNLIFYSTPMTRQTTLNSLLGFISINGVYVPSVLRKAVEFGGLMLLDEIDAGDPNVLLSLNSLENGYLAFPDGIVDVHNDFRLCATSNPADEHQKYTGRSKLDAATLDRFDIVYIERDPLLEAKLTCKLTALEMGVMRDTLEDFSVSKSLTRRDSIRFYKRKQIGLAEDYAKILLGNTTHMYDKYCSELEKQVPKPQTHVSQNDCTTIDELWELVEKESTYRQWVAMDSTPNNEKD